MTAAGSPHSETLGSKPARRLPEAYRCPPRLSSVPSAKASTIRPCKQPHTRGKPARPTNTGRQIINTLRSQNDQTNNQTPNKGDPVEIHQYKQTTTSHPHRGGHAVRSRPLSSSQTTTPHHTPPPGTPGKEPMAGTRTPTPTQGGRGGQGTQQHAHTRPRKGGATILPRQHARHPRGRPPRYHARQTMKFSVERR